MFDRNSITKETKNIIDLQNSIQETLLTDKEMFSSTRLLRILTDSEYFKINNIFEWPLQFKTFLNKSKLFSNKLKHTEIFLKVYITIKLFFLINFILNSF